MGLNEVFKKVADINEVTELASHKVDLGMAEDVKKAYNDAINSRKMGFDIYSKVKADMAVAIKKLNDIKKANENAIAMFVKYEAAAKQLGLPLPAEILQQKQNIQDGLKGNVTSYPKTLESIKL